MPEVKADEGEHTVKELPPLIIPGDLPDDLLEDLTYSEIQRVGYFLFGQLKKQRDEDVKFFSEGAKE